MGAKRVTGLVLAGGKGSRMGGKDKGLLPLLNRPLLGWVMERLAPQVGDLLISANRNQGLYSRFGCPVLSDPEDIPDPGPLGGIAKALGVIQDPYLAVVPCDAPFLPHDLVIRLMACQERTGRRISVAHDGKRLQSLFALVHREAAKPLREYLLQGGRKVEGFWTAQGAAWELFPDAELAFFNVNRPEDLALATDILLGKVEGIGLGDLSKDQNSNAAEGRAVLP
jgi:molybdopterin-guanine dinucleotide biosynthesis protein A